MGWRWGLWRPPRDRIGSSPARYKKWAPRPGPGSRAGEGARVSVLQCWWDPAPPRASLCKAPAPARSASARGKGRSGQRVFGGGDPGGPPPNCPGPGGVASSLRPRQQRPLGEEKGLAPIQSEVLTLCFLPQVLPLRPDCWAFVHRAQASRRPPAAHTVLSSIHSVLVKARRALATPSPRSPSSPAAPPPATSRCGVDRWRFVRRARRG